MQDGFWDFLITNIGILSLAESAAAMLVMRTNFPLWVLFCFELKCFVCHASLE